MYWICLTVDGEPYWESCKTHNKTAAKKILAIRQAEILEGRFSLLKKHAPALGVWSEKYLESVQHANTRERYACSRVALIRFFGKEMQLSHINSGKIAEFIKARRNEKLKSASVNRDLRFLAQLLKQAERERYIARSPFDSNKFFLNESKERRQPLVLSWEEQARLLAVCPPRIRVLTVLGVETGMRTGEMLSLRWPDIDFLNDTLRVVKSKTASGSRMVPISAVCKSELLRWRSLTGPENSEWVFPNFSNKRHKLQGGRKAWTSALTKAGLAYRPIYYLRHTFATRMTAAGVSPLTIAQMLGHSGSSQIVPRYAQVLDQNRLDAMKKLESLRLSAILAHNGAAADGAETLGIE